MSAKGTYNIKNGNSEQFPWASRVDKRSKIFEFLFPLYSNSKRQRESYKHRATKHALLQRDSPREFHHQWFISWYDCFLWGHTADAEILFVLMRAARELLFQTLLFCGIESSSFLCPVPLVPKLKVVIYRFDAYWAIFMGIFSICKLLLNLKNNNQTSFI